jgi:hypothetical protein
MHISIFFIIIQQILTQNMWCIGMIINIFHNKLQMITFKINFLWKNQYNYKKTHSPFIK